MAEATAFTLQDLAQIIAHRMEEGAPSSYTAKLKAGGMAFAAKKLGEEGVETVIAALVQDHTTLVKESADLLYHLLVVLHMRQISLQDVLHELQQRTYRSGLEEKAARKVD